MITSRNTGRKANTGPGTSQALRNANLEWRLVGGRSLVRRMAELLGSVKPECAKAYCKVEDSWDDVVTSAG